MRVDAGPSEPSFPLLISFPSPRFLILLSSRRATHLATHHLYHHLSHHQTMSSGQRWTPEQDKLLHEACADSPEHCWRIIADELSGRRTASACSSRWRLLKAKEKKEKEKKKRRAFPPSPSSSHLADPSLASPPIPSTFSWRRKGLEGWEDAQGEEGQQSKEVWFVLLLSLPPSSHADPLYAGKPSSKEVDGPRPSSTNDQVPNRRSPSLHSPSVKVDDASTTSNRNRRESPRPLFPKRTQRSVSPSDSVRRSSSPTPTVNAAPRYRSTTPSSRSPSPQLHPRKYSLHKYSSKRKAAALDCHDEDEEDLFAEVEQQSRKKRKTEMTDKELDERCLTLLERVVGVVEKIQARRGA